MSTTEFDNNVAFGKIGTGFVYSHFTKGTGLYATVIDKTEDNHIEGQDLTALIMKCDSEPIELGDLSWAGITEKEAYPIKLMYGGIEVKTQHYDTFMLTDKRNKNPHGSLAFPIWKHTDRKSYGYLYEMLFPKESHSVQPLSICFVLTDNNERPFSIITFPDFEQLVDRLNDLAGDSYDICSKEFWDKIPLSNFKFRLRGLSIASNLWIIPFDNLCDLANVTMVAPDPEFVEDRGKCSVEVQQSRLEFLKEC